jgi:hypothetical protein
MNSGLPDFERLPATIRTLLAGPPMAAAAGALGAPGTAIGSKEPLSITMLPLLAWALCPEGSLALGAKPLGLEEIEQVAVVDVVEEGVSASYILAVVVRRRHGSFVRRCSRRPRRA